MYKLYVSKGKQYYLRFFLFSCIVLQLLIRYEYDWLTQ